MAESRGAELFLAKGTALAEVWPRREISDVTSSTPGGRNMKGVWLDRAKQLKERDDVLDQLADLFILRSTPDSIFNGKLRDELLN